MPGLHWLLFDLDGCLVDSRRPIAASINHGLEQLGLAPEPEDQLHGWIGASLDSVFRALLEARGADPERAPEGVEHYRALYAEVSLQQTRPFPGIPEVLAELARERVLAVATSKPEAFAAPILERLALREHFALVSAPPLDGTHQESKEQTVARAVAQLGADPGATAMVGDRHFDMRAGRASGLLSVGVTWGIGDAAELRDAGAHHLVEDASGLLAVLGGAPVADGAG